MNNFFSSLKFIFLCFSVFNMTAATKIVESRSVLYINVVIEDASEAIKQGVADKFAQKDLPEGLKKRLGKHIGKIAANMAPASAIVDKMAPKMVADMPVKMKPNGLTVHAEEVFREGPMFVLMMQVQHVDAAVMIEAQQMAEEDREEKESMAVRCVQWLLNLVGVKLADTVQTNHLPKLIQAKMQPNMGEMMKKEMTEKNMKASIEVLPEAQQARFFYALLCQVREAEKAKPRGPPRPFATKKSK